MKTTPEEATRKARAARLKSVAAVVRQRTAKVSGKKELVLVVTFVVESEGRRASGRMVDSSQSFLIDGSGNKVHIPGTRKDWTIWEAPKEPVRAAVLSAVYGTTNVKNDPKSNTAAVINWESRRIRRALEQRVRRQVETKKAATLIQKAKRAERRTDLVEEIGELLKKYPEMRKQDVLSAFEEARQIQVVREVMDT